MKSILPKSFFIFFAESELKNFLCINFIFICNLCWQYAGSMPITFKFFFLKAFKHVPSLEPISKTMLFF